MTSRERSATAWALVTGSSRGIGRACAHELARRGHGVVVTARDTEALGSLRDELAAAGQLVVAMPCDLGSRQGVETLLEELRAQALRIDVLVNNAGLGSSTDPRPLTEFSDGTWDRTLHLNLTVPYLLTKALLPGMVTRGHGRIVNVASIVAKVGFRNGSAYAASKHGLLGLTRSAAAEVADQGVTINAVCPGPTATRMNDARMRFEAETSGRSFEAVAGSSTPIGRRVKPEEVASCVGYLASSDAAAITGQAFNVDGGLVTH